MDIIQDQHKPTTPSRSISNRLEVHVCHRCRWPFPNPHPSDKRRRSHNRICGTIEGYANVIDSEADSDDEHHSHSDDSDDSDDQEQEKEKNPSHESHEVHICLRCGWPFPNRHPNSKHRRAHKRICGSIEGYTKLITDSEAVFDDEHHSEADDEEQEEKTPSPNIEKKIIKESGGSAGRNDGKSYISESDRFSDAVTEFSDTGISPGVTSEVKKMDEFEDHDLNMKRSVPLVEDSNGSHKDKVIDQMSEVSGNKDQGEDVHELSVASDIPLVDKAKTLIEDFKDYKSMHSNVSRNDKQAGSGSVVDIFEVKTAQECVHESQTSKHEEAKVAETQPLEMSKTVTESTNDLSEAEASHDNRSVMTLGERIEAESKEAVINHSVPVLTEVCPQETVKEPKSGIEAKVETSETLVGEGSGKLLTGVDASVGWSSSSLEGIWGSVSEISDVFVKSELSDDRSRLAGRSDAFAGSSLVESDQEIFEQKASEIKANEEAIAKVTNWSTIEAKSSDPKRLSDLVKKIEETETTSETEKSNLTRETNKVNQESSAQTDSGEGEKAEKKTKGLPSWMRFLCCSVSIER